MVGRPQEQADNLGPSFVRTPKSPWLPFSMLFTAISNEVPEKDMDLVQSYYVLFQVCISETGYF